MIELKNVTVSFGPITVLKNLNAKMGNGDFITLIGANGSGKSTLFDIISGKTKPQSGQILFDGQDVTHLNELQRAPLVGRLFQNTHLSSVPSMTVRENLAMATFKSGRVGFTDGLKNFPTHIVDEVLKPMNLNLESLLDKPMGSLSGGQRQIVSLIMATLIPPKILLLDEPTAALDPQSATRLLVFAARIIKEHKITTLLITHDPHIATTLGNKLWVLEKGSIGKTFGEEKENLSTDHLIGEIDYEQLALV